MDTISSREFNRASSALDSRPVRHANVHGEVLPIYAGLIARLNEAGYGIILDSERREHPFVFSAIIHYRGESASTLATRGVILGQRVNFAQVADKVVYVEPITSLDPPSR